jgi:hypothetical protein
VRGSRLFGRHGKRGQTQQTGQSQSVYKFFHEISPKVKARKIALHCRAQAMPDNLFQ